MFDNYDSDEEILEKDNLPRKLKFLEEIASDPDDSRNFEAFNKIKYSQRDIQIARRQSVNRECQNSPLFINYLLKNSNTEDNYFLLSMLNLMKEGNNRQSFLANKVLIDKEMEILLRQNFLQIYGNNIAIYLTANMHLYSYLRKYIENDLDEDLQYEAIKLLKSYSNLIPGKMVELLHKPESKYYLENAFLFIDYSYIIRKCKTKGSEVKNFCSILSCFICCPICAIPLTFFGIYNRSSNCFLNYRKNLNIALNIINSYVQTDIILEKSFLAAEFILQTEKNIRNISKSTGMNYTVGYDYESALNIIRTISRDPENKNHDNAVRILFNLNLSELSYISNIKKERNIEHINCEFIKTLMFKDLEDLSNLEMDLCSEFEKIILKYNCLDQKDSIIQYLENIESKKEHSLWNMYEENKNSTINALKNIVLYMNKEEDEQVIKICLETLANAFIHCPTGQSEGIEYAVNMLVRKEYTSLKSKIGKYFLHNGIKKAFYSANYEGEVHELSSLRGILKEKFNIDYAIEDFEEIYKNHDNENEFFKIFNVEFLVNEFKNNLQTHEEFVIVAEGKNKEYIKFLKENKPINLGEIIEWLHDNNHELIGISEDYTQINDLGIVNFLIKFGILTECDKNKRLISRLEKFYSSEI